MNHCKIRYETDEDLAEFDDFYNFSSSYETYTKRMKLNVDKNDEVEGEEEEKEEKEEKEEVEEREEGEGDERAVVLLEESVKGYFFFLFFFLFFLVFSLSLPFPPPPFHSAFSSFIFQKKRQSHRRRPRTHFLKRKSNWPSRLRRLLQTKNSPS